MFNRKYEERLHLWSKFRESLEVTSTPLQDVIDFYSLAPTINISLDPWDQKTWPGPWELIDENTYCDFARVLGMCYSLQLTERFKESSFEIHICIDNTKSETYYLLYIDMQHVLGYKNQVVDISEVPDTLVSQLKHTMPSLQ